MARVAFIVANDFEDSEFREPYERLRRAGHEVTVIGSESGTPIQGKKGKEKIVPDTSIDKVSTSDYDALRDSDAIVVAPTGAEDRHVLSRRTRVRRCQYGNRRSAAERHLPDLARRPVADPLAIGRKERIETALGAGHHRGG